MDDPFDLQRFVRAQAPVYAQALSELGAGRKRSHWMWYVFPQPRGLGHSPVAKRFGLASRAEAHAYLAQELLGSRLRECTAAVLSHAATPVDRIFGYPDDLKFHSCMTLFAEVGEPSDLFHQALDAFFDGQPDMLTRQMLDEASGECAS